MIDGPVEIRKGLPEDREAIVSMAAEVVEAGDVFVFENPKDVVEYWYQPGGHIFIAAREDEVLGTYVIKPNQKGRGAHVANTGYMVRRSARGLGVGTAMGEHSLQSAPSWVSPPCSSTWLSRQMPVRSACGSVSGLTLLEHYLALSAIAIMGVWTRW